MLLIDRPDEPVKLNFPEHISLGELWLMESTDCFTCGNGQKNLGDATGYKAITMPSSGDWYLELRLPQHATKLMQYLESDPSLKMLESINLEQSNVQDSDLQFIKNYQLRRINLKATNITGEGLSYLKTHPTWINVDISCNSTLEFGRLSHFSDWKQATISVTGWCGSAQDEISDIEEQRLIEEAGKSICSSGVLDQCAQVR